MRNGALGLLALWILAGASARAAEPGVNTIQKVSVKGGTVEIVGTRKPSFTTFPMTDPPRFVIDISEAVFASVPEDIPVPSGGRITAVKTAAYGSDASGIARVVIGFDRIAEPDVQASGNTLVVKVGTGTPPAVAARSTPPAPPSSAAQDRSAIDQTRALAAAAPTASASKTSSDATAQEALARAQAAKQEADRKAAEEAKAAALAAEQQKAELARQREAIAAAEAERQAKVRAEQEKAAQERAARERVATEAQARAEAQRRAEEEAARAAAERRKAAEAATLAAAAQAEANRKAQQEAAARAAKAEAERKAQEDAARAAAEQQRAKEAAAQAAAEQQRAKEATALAAAEQQRAKEESARAAAEQRKAQEDAARAASARGEAERKAQQEAALREQRIAAERRAQEEAARAAADQRKAQEDAARAAAEARRPTLVASAERASPTHASTGAPAASAVPPATGGSAEVSGRRKRVMIVGFTPDKSLVYVRTNEPVRYTVSQVDAHTVVLELENTIFVRRNDRRPLDARFFGGPVVEIVPSPASGKTVRVAVTLRDKVGYQARQDGNEVSLQFAP